MNAKYDEINGEFKVEGKRRGVYKFVKSVLSKSKGGKDSDNREHSDNNNNNNNKKKKSNINSR